MVVNYVINYVITYVINYVNTRKTELDTETLKMTYNILLLSRSSELKGSSSAVLLYKHTRYCYHTVLYTQCYFPSAVSHQPSLKLKKC